MDGPSRAGSNPVTPAIPTGPRADRRQSGGLAASTSRPTLSISLTGPPPTAPKGPRNVLSGPPLPPSSPSKPTPPPSAGSGGTTPFAAGGSSNAPPPPSAPKAMIGAFKSLPYTNRSSTSRTNPLLQPRSVPSPPPPVASPKHDQSVSPAKSRGDARYSEGVTNGSSTFDVDSRDREYATRIRETSQPALVSSASRSRISIDRYEEDEYDDEDRYSPPFASSSREAEALARSAFSRAQSGKTPSSTSSRPPPPGLAPKTVIKLAGATTSGHPTGRTVNGKQVFAVRAVNSEIAGRPINIFDDEGSLPANNAQPPPPPGPSSLPPPPPPPPPVEDIGSGHPAAPAIRADAVPQGPHTLPPKPVYGHPTPPHTEQPLATTTSSQNRVSAEQKSPTPAAQEPSLSPALLTPVSSADPSSSQAAQKVQPPASSATPVRKDLPPIIALPPGSPPRSTFPPLPKQRPFLVTYDPAFDQSAVKRGAKPILRYEGEGVDKPVPDPRRKPEYKQLLGSSKRQRLSTRLSRLVYEYDEHSTGPPPPPPACAVCITALTRLTTLDKILSHLAAYGAIVEHEFKTDPMTGGSLGICWIRYADDVPRTIWTEKGKEKRMPSGRAAGQDGHVSALEAVQRLNGQKVVPLCGTDGRVKVELDWDGRIAKRAAEAEIERRHPKPKRSAPTSGRDQPKQTAQPASLSPVRQSSSTPLQQAGSSSASSRPLSSSLPPRPPSLPAKPTIAGPNPVPSILSHAAVAPNGLTDVLVSPAKQAARQPYKLPAANSQARSPQRLGGSQKYKGMGRESGSSSDSSYSSDEDDGHSRYRRRDEDDDRVYYPRNAGRSGPSSNPSSSPYKDERSTNGVSGVALAAAEAEREDLTARKRVMQKLRDQGFPYVSILKADLVILEQERKVKVLESFIRGLLGKHNPVNVWQDSLAWYCTFRKDDAAAKAHKYTDQKPLLGVPITMHLNEVPTQYAIDELDSQIRSTDIIIDAAIAAARRADASSRTRSSPVPRRRIKKTSGWTDSELVEETVEIIVRDLKDAFQNDLRKRVVPTKIAEAVHRYQADIETTQKASRSATPLAGNGMDAHHSPNLQNDSSKVIQTSALPLVPATTSQSLPAGKLPSFARKKGARGRRGSSSVTPAPTIFDRQRSGSIQEGSDSRSPVFRQRGRDDDEVSIATSEASSQPVRKLSKGMPSKQASARESPPRTADSVEPKSAVGRHKAPKAKKDKKSAPEVVFTSSSEDEAEMQVDTPVPEAIAPPPSTTDLVREYPPVEVPAPKMDGVEAAQQLEFVIPKPEDPEPVMLTSQAEAPPASAPIALPEIAQETAQPVGPPKDETEEEKKYRLNEERKQKRRDRDKRRKERLLAEKEAAKEARLQAKAVKVEVDPASLPAAASDGLFLPALSNGTVVGAADVSLGGPAPATAVPKKSASLELAEVPKKVKKPPKPRQRVFKAKAVDASGTRSPSPDPVSLGLAEDEEDLYYLRLALDRYRAGEDYYPPDQEEEDVPVAIEGVEPEDEPEPRHDTGSARTEGYYKISQIEKLTYLSSRNQAQVSTSQAANNSSIAVSRLARVNNRHLARDKKGTASDTDLLQFNQLRTRKKQMRFQRSPIHDWGLYAAEHIPAGEMVIEYVGETIRQQVADKREKQYERQGIGSSYLFRVDDDIVVDATMKGNLGRLINHSCTPNCTARILSVGNSKKIVIYAKQPIWEGDEITYDYHFPIEDEKIPCLCGSTGCRGFLN